MGLLGQRRVLEERRRLYLRPEQGTRRRRRGLQLWRSYVKNVNYPWAAQPPVSPSPDGEKRRGRLDPLSSSKEERQEVEGQGWGQR